MFKIDIVGTKSYQLFISPKPKAQVSFSDETLSVGRRRLRRCGCRKLFTISFSSPEPQDQFQPNFAQSIVGLKEFNFVQRKGPALFQGRIFPK